MATDSIPSKEVESADTKEGVEDAQGALPWDEQEEKRLVRKIDARCLVRLPHTSARYALWLTFSGLDGAACACHCTFLFGLLAGIVDELTSVYRGVVVHSQLHREFLLLPHQFFSLS